MKFKSIMILFSFISLVLQYGQMAHADVYDLPATELVMNKKYHIANEGTFGLGYLPVGAFNKYLAVGGSYTHLFNDVHGWEVANILYTVEMQAALKQDLIAGYGGRSEDFAVLKFLATTNYIYSPFYTKSLLFNSSIVHSQLSFLAGGGVANYSILTAPAVDVGIIQKFFLGEKTSLKLDFRYYTFFSTQKTVRNHITMMAGISYNFGAK